MFYSANKDRKKIDFMLTDILEVIAHCGPRQIWIDISPSVGTNYYYTPQQPKAFTVAVTS